VAFKVTIRNAGRTIAVEPGQSILEAAILAGIDYPCSCQSGTCGSCKSELIAGEVDMSPYADFALLAEERTDGMILACRAAPLADCDVAWIEPDDLAVHPRRILDCRVAAIEAASHDVRRVLLDIRAGGPFAFAAGQYAALTFDDLPPRDFSMANRPGTEPLEFHIRHVAGGAVSRHVCETLKVGDPVRLEGPFGQAHYRDAHRGPIVAVAGSTGLAPVLSIVETALAGGARRPVLLYVGARAERDLYALDRLQALGAGHRNLRVEIVLSDPDAPTARRTGLVSDAVAADFSGASALDGAKAYIAGPPAMVEAAIGVLRARGVRGQDCHADPFYTEAEKAALAVSPR